MKYTVRGKRKVYAHPVPIQVVWDNGKIDTDVWTWLALKKVDREHIGQKLGYILSECDGIGNHYEHEDCLHHIIDDLMEEGYSIEIQIDDGTIVHSWDDMPEEEGGDLVVTGIPSNRACLAAHDGVWERQKPAAFLEGHAGKKPVLQGIQER